MDLCIREVMGSDAPAISKLMVRSFVEDLAVENTPEFTARMVQVWTPEHVSRLLLDRYTLVACHNEEIVGTASLHANSLRMVAVRPDHQRCGTGTKLLRPLIQRATAASPVLTVQSTLLAERFYQKLGFVKQRDHFSAGQRYVLMELVLSSQP